MSKQEYEAPTGAPPSWNQGNSTSGGGYVPQQQPAYTPNDQDRGFGGFGGHQQGYGGGYQQGGYPPQGGYGGGYPQGGYPPQGQGYYQQQQPMYVQQQRGGGSEGCLMACLGALCICCTLDMLF
ncbi:hypothetical protein JA9_003808 [Meyerozyma sp. JA9]|nr:hypothetical protein JA9_003808 [Meyerozyma sp. JA9]